MLPILLALSVAAQSTDSVRQARYRDVGNRLLDALDSVQAATAAFRADLGAASARLVLERAARVAAACRRADSSQARFEQVLDQDPDAAKTPRAQANLRRSGGDLRRALGGCRRDWTVAPHATVLVADSLRAWGPYRISRIDGPLRHYYGVVVGFLKKLGLSRLHE